jgi:hypothetical protein
LPSAIGSRAGCGAVGKLEGVDEREEEEDAVDGKERGRLDAPIAGCGDTKLV